MNIDPRKSHRAISRREFVRATALGSAAALLPRSGFAAPAEQKFAPPVIVFSKVYQTLKLNFDEAAQVTAEAGLDGLEPPVRPGGEVEPERVEEELPRYAETLRKRGLSLPLVTTGITSVASPNAEAVLRTARKLPVQYYRLGFMDLQANVPLKEQIKKIKADLKELAALNKQIGIGGVIENHSAVGNHSYIGGNLDELVDIVGEFDPEQIGVALDIGHALNMHGKDWRPRFDKLKGHVKVAYVKDVKPGQGWVPFGEGEVGTSGYFTLLKEMNYRAPISMHIEFDWTDKGRAKNRPALVKALKESATVLRRWLAKA